MRHYPGEGYEQEGLSRLNAAPWMVEALRCNPSYCSWGPYEDYMWVPGRDEPKESNPHGKDGGWGARVLVDTWADFGPWDLDELNICANFYYEINRESKECPLCAGNGYHPDSQWVSESFYEHSSPFTHQTAQQRMGRAFLGNMGVDVKDGVHGRGNYPSQETLRKYGHGFRDFCEEMSRHHSWNHRITQDEVDALLAAGRLHEIACNFVEGQGWVRHNRTVSADQANAWSSGKGLGHDAINRCILIRRRCERLGLPIDCPECDGHGYVYTEDEAHLSLVLWWLHPRKGCSRGIHIKRITETELPETKAFLKRAAEQNALRFNGIMVQ